MDTLVHLYAPALVGLLGVCALFLCREPADDPLSDAAYGDYPAIPNDLKVSRFHNTAIITEGQRCGE